MEVAYEILIDALKEYAAEIIATGLVFVTFWLWRRYKKKIISGMKFFVLFVLAVIVAVGVWFVAAYLGGAFVLGFGSGAVVAVVIWAVSRLRSRKSEESVTVAEETVAQERPAVDDKTEETQEYKFNDLLIKDVSIFVLPKIEYLIALIYERGGEFAIAGVKWRDTGIFSYNWVSDLSKMGEYFKVTRNQHNADYWRERSAEHGYASAQYYIVDDALDNLEYYKAYLWLYIGNLCESYFKGLNDEEKNIRKKILEGDSDTFNTFYYSYRKEYDVRDRLSESEKTAIEDEAKAKFEGIKKFWQIQVEAYKQEHPNG